MKTFSDFKIPCYFHEGVSAAQTPEGKGIQLILKLADSDFSRFNVIELLTSGLIEFHNLRGNETEVSPARWDLISKEAGIVSGYKSWTDRLHKLMKRKEKELNFTDNPAGKVKLEQYLNDIDILLSVVKRLRDFLKQFKQKDTWQNFSEHTVSISQKLLKDLGARKTVEGAILGLKRLVTINGNDSVTLRRFKGFVNEKMNSSLLPSAKFAAGNVGIFSGASSAGIRFKHVFFPGMLSGQYPRKFPGNPLMNDDERAVFNTYIDWGTKNKLPITAELEKGESHLFSILARSAGDSMVFTYPRLSRESRQSNVISEYLLDIASILAGRQIFPDDIQHLPCFRHIAPSVYRMGQAIDAGGCVLADVPEYKLFNLLKSSAARSQDDFNDLISLTPCLEKTMERHWNLNGSSGFTGNDGLMSNGALLSKLGVHLDKVFEVASPSLFEEYYSCPRRFFLKRIMGIVPEEAPEDIREISPKHRGIIYHEIYRRFLQELKKENKLPIADGELDEYKERIKSIARNEFHEFEEASLCGDESSWFEKKVEIFRGMDDFVINESGYSVFEPRLFEFAFGRDKKAVRLNLGSNVEQQYAGRIDRVDFDSTGRKCCVIDYKTGKPNKYKDNSFAGGKQLQLPLYLNSIDQLVTELDDIRDSSAQYYFATTKGGFKKICFNGENFLDRKDDLIRLIQGVLTGTRMGIFIPTPEDIKPNNAGVLDGVNCSYCDFRQVCPVDLAAIYERKRPDAAIEAFLEMKEIQ